MVLIEVKMMRSSFEEQRSASAVVIGWCLEFFSKIAILEMRQYRDQAHQGQPQLTSVDHPNQLSTTIGSTDVILLSILFPDN